MPTGLAKKFVMISKVQDKHFSRVKDNQSYFKYI
jgi:hypothetical protein